MRQLPALVKFDSLNIISLREAGEELIIEATADGSRPGTGEPFHMRYVWF